MEAIYLENRVSILLSLIRNTKPYFPEKKNSLISCLLISQNVPKVKNKCKGFKTCIDLLEKKIDRLKQQKN